MMMNQAVQGEARSCMVYYFVVAVLVLPSVAP